MEELTDEEVIARVREGDSPAFLELSRRHSGTVVNVIQKFMNRMVDRQYSRYDMMHDKDIILHRAAISFNPKKGSKYSTWATNQARYFCLTFLKKGKRVIPLSDYLLPQYPESEYFEAEDAEPELLEGNPAPDAGYEDNSMRQKDLFFTVSKYIRNNVEPQDRGIVAMRLLRSKAAPWGEISKKTGKSLSYIKKKYFSEIKKLRKLLTD